MTGLSVKHCIHFITRRSWKPAFVDLHGNLFLVQDVDLLG
jgi:hypothetical protein